MNIPRVRLTELSGQGGCSAKISQADLAGVLRGISTSANEHLLVSADSMDDAAVYRLSDDLALVSTVDFFPPPVDDPRDYGAIATANALSDVYAMGGQPLLLLNLVGFDLNQLEAGVLRAILEGGAQIAAEAGCAVAGGHSIRSSEPIFGCAVIGTVDPGKVVTNAGASPGDAIFLTKPLGTGIILNAHKQQAAPPATLSLAVGQMRRLNRDSAAAMVRVGAHAATDVTGFGLLGHAANLARASGVTLEITATELPLLEGVVPLLRAGYLPGGSRRNLELAQQSHAVDPSVSPELAQLACDAQTSGGLIVCLAPGAADHFQRLLPEARRIGRVSAVRSDRPVVLS